MLTSTIIYFNFIVLLIFYQRTIEIEKYIQFHSDIWFNLKHIGDIKN